MKRRGKEEIEESESESQGYYDYLIPLIPYSVTNPSKSNYYITHFYETQAEVAKLVTFLHFSSSSLFQTFTHLVVACASTPSTPEFAVIGTLLNVGILVNLLFP